MLTRRALLLTSAAGLAATWVAGRLPPFAAGALAAPLDQASSFIEQVSKELVAVVNSGAPLSQRQLALQKIIDRTVDVPDVARFCLGRFWRQATPEQQKEYVDLFHRVLLNNITAKVGEYQGVNIVLNRASPRESDVAVNTTVTRPGNAPNKVDWVVSTATGSPKIVDVIAEGTSLRLTQRQDYASYLARNNNSVQALIEAMRQQASQSG